MSTDDRRSEQFIREVDEELRRAQLKAIWDRFAPLIVGVCVLVVVVTAGYRGWVWWQERQAATAGDRFMAALEKVSGDKRAEGEAELAKIAGEGGEGYAALAKLRLAGEKAAGAQTKEAIAAYDALAADQATSASLRSLAQVRAAMLSLDSGDFTGATQRAEALNVAGGPWRHAAREVLGMAAYQNGELAKAREHFTSIQQDAETPPDLWVRSGMMVALIDGQLAVPEDDAAAAADDAAGTTPAATDTDAAAPSPPAAASNPAAETTSAPAATGSAAPAPAGAGAPDEAEPVPAAAPAATAPAPAPAPQTAPAPAPSTIPPQ